VLKWKWFFRKVLGKEKNIFLRPSPHTQGTMWGFLVASRCIFFLIMTLLGHRNTATTKKLDFENSHLTSVEAKTRALEPRQLPRCQGYARAKLRPSAAACWGCKGGPPATQGGFDPSNFTWFHTAGQCLFSSGSLPSARKSVSFK
jgi:hypothetical protein